MKLSLYFCKPLFETSEMTTTKRIISIFTITLFFLTMNPANSFADPPPDPCGDPFDPACPIDGGLTLLLAAGAGIGAVKYRGKKP